jgi:hypothetical protein
MTRLRDKGGASPQTLYDLVNGHVDASGSPTIRPGTVHDVSIPAGTKGLCAFQGKMHVFSTQQVVSPNPLYVVDILKHPDPTYVGGLFKIHFAKPYLGFLYVVAEFEDNTVRHYWLQNPSVWAPNTIYGLDALVSPSVKNGFFYKAVTKSVAPAWASGQSKAIGDVVQPGTPNGWEYVVTDVTGTPTTGDAEPAWPTSEGATVFEGTDTITIPSADGSAGSISPSTPGQGTIDRYGDGT